MHCNISCSPSKDISVLSLHKHLSQEPPTCLRGWGRVLVCLWKAVPSDSKGLRPKQCSPERLMSPGELTHWKLNTSKSSDLVEWQESRCYILLSSNSHYMQVILAPSGLLLNIYQPSTKKPTEKEPETIPITCSRWLPRHDRLLGSYVPPHTTTPTRS